MNKFKEKVKNLLTLFLTFFKIGIFTFGGGYAMIPLVERECVSKKKWMEHNEFMDMIAIAESTPGPIAINMATYTGFRQGGVLGSAFATFGVVLPSFIIIFVISLFFDKFLELKLVSYAFRGIQACVIYLILNAGVKMVKKLEKKPLNYILFGATLICMTLLSIFAVSFSSIFYILIGGSIALIIYLIIYGKNRYQKKLSPISDTPQEEAQPQESKEEKENSLSMIEIPSVEENHDNSPALENITEENQEGGNE